MHLTNCKLIVYTVLLFAGFHFSSCYYDVEEVIYPIEDCDTTDILYSDFVLPLLENNCYACHGNGATQGGVDHGNYDKLKVQVDNGRFLGAISHNSGYSPMPQGAPQLLDCQIQKVTAWINDGALNN